MGHETIQVWQKEEVVGDVLEKLDPVRSEFGAARVVTTNSSTFLVNIPAGKVFHITTIIVGAHGTTAAQRRLTALVRINLRRSAVSSVILRAIHTGASHTAAKFSNFVATNIKGFVIVASTVTRYRLRVSAIGNSISIRIGGFLRDRLAGETST